MAGFIGSPAWKKFMAKLYGLGAAIVIVGAMFKIMHWPGAGPMLVFGLTVEAIIFFFSAFEPLHEEIDWSLVYPELSGMHGEEGHGHEEEIEEEVVTMPAGNGISQQLDAMLKDANIGPELIESLGTGLRTLGDQAAKLNDLTDASVVTEQYSTSVKAAAQNIDTLSSSYKQANESLNRNVESLSSSYTKAADALQSITISNEDSNNFGVQLSNASVNLSALNASYELQLQSSDVHLKSASKFYAGINELMGSLDASVEDTRKYKEEIAKLSTNLASLNTVYGNMLTAMRS
jgi:gliding motility-associated protein GldL